MYESFQQAERLMLRIRALKWHAATLATSTPDATTRVQAVAVAAELQDLEVAGRGEATEHSLAITEKCLDVLTLRISQLSPHGSQ